MRGDGHKGEGRSIGNLVWLPLVVALLVQYALAAPLVGSGAGKASSGPSPVTYEVTVSQNGQVHASAAKEASSAADTSPSNGSAAEAFLQAAGEEDAISALRDEEKSPFEAVRARVAKEAAIAKVQQRQAGEERSKQLRIDNVLKQAVGLDELKVRGYDISDERMVQLVEDPLDYTVDIEFIDQRDLLPSGCEIIALSIALHCMGYEEADPIEIADKYVEYGSDSAKYFTGSPYSDGGGFPPCIVDAANKWLKDNGGGAKAFDLTGSSFEGLCALVELGYPVLVWTTDDMAEPYIGSEWYLPEHCVIMYGLEKKSKRDEKHADEEKSTGSTSSGGAASQVKSESSSRASSPEGSSSASASPKSAASAKNSSSVASSSASKSSSAAAVASSSSSSSSASSSAAPSNSSSGASSKSASKQSGSKSSGSSSASSQSVSKSSPSALSSSSSSSASSSAAPSNSSSGTSSKSASKQSSSKSSESSSATPAPVYTKVKVSDSLAGLVSRDYDDFKRIYDKTGKRALFIQPNAK